VNSGITECFALFGGFMYAIIRTGGKQYRVQAGQTVRVEKLEKNIGETFDLTDVLAVGGEKSVFGTPVVAGAKVTVTVVQHDKAAKVLVFKKKRRHGYRRTQGHRQSFTDLFVQAITSPNGESEKASVKPIVVDPAKKAARIEAIQAKVKAGGKSAKKELKVKAAAKKAAKKTSAKPAAAKKKASAGAKKKVAKKKSSKK
jgi:large subunit ribosomal protein L21